MPILTIRFWCIILLIIGYTDMIIMLQLDIYSCVLPPQYIIHICILLYGGHPQTKNVTPVICCDQHECNQISTAFRRDEKEIKQH